MIRRKRIWLIGAGSGIGKSLALKLAAAGNQVAISGRNVVGLDAVALEAASSGGAGKLFPVACDVTDDQQMASVLSSVETALGGLDMLIYCAGRCEYIDNADMKTDLFRRVYEVNVFGMVNAIQGALPLLKRSGNAPQIVGVASMSAVVGLPRAEAYGSSKAAAIYMLDALRLDLTDQKIDVTVVNPGFVETPMTDSNDFPMPFLMQGDQAADCIIAGVSKRKRTVNFPFKLWFSLKLAALFPSLWYRVIGPRLARNESST